MRTQVYAVVHDGQGHFLVAIKNLRGYFFHTDGGVIIPKGEELNGGGNYAFPGGELEGGKPENGAALEFQEETHIQLQSLALKPAAFHGIQGPELDYYGVYFQLQPEELKALETKVQTNLVIGSNAANAVIDGTYGVGQYAKLLEAFPASPVDNELDSVDVWNLHEKWAEIETWKGSQTLGWFFNILLNLKNA